MNKVLVIEQDLSISSNISQLLSLSNFDVLNAFDGPSGIEMAYQSEPDIIICSRELPVIDGLGVLHLIRQQAGCSNVIFIMISPKLEWEEIRLALDNGIDDFIFRPLNCSEIMMVIKKRIKNQQSNEQERKYLNGASKSDLTSLINNKPEISLRKKQQIYREGARASHLYYVKSGTVKEYKINDDGKEFILNIYKPGDFFGYFAMLENSLHTETSETIEDTVLVEIPQHEFTKFIEENPLSMRYLINKLTQNIKQQEHKLINIAYNSLRKKVADTLIELHHKFCIHNQELYIELSRDNLAAIVGVAKESLIRTLKDFEQESLINLTHNKVKVINLKKLETMVN